MHENTKKNVNCTIKKNPNKPKHGKYYLNYLLQLFSHQQFSIPHSLWSVVISHGTCLIHSKHSPQTKLVKKFPSKQFFTEKYRNTEPRRFRRGALFSIKFHKMTACFVPSQLLGCKEAWPRKRAPSWALQGVQTPKAKSPKSLHLCLNCLFQMTALEEGGKESAVLKTDILSGLSTTPPDTLVAILYL